MLYFYFGNLILKEDFSYVIRFWTTLLSIGIIFLPLTSIILNKFHDNGWIFSKIIGIGISGWLTWILSYTKIFQYTLTNCYIIIALLTVSNACIYIFNRKKININTHKIKNIFITELIFLILLFSWSYLRSLSPGIDNSTEKYMDYGYMNSIMNSEYMPPTDIWLSGNSINYYYFGQYISGYLCKISNLQVNEGYNLMIALIASLSFLMPYTIGYNLLRKPLLIKNNFNKICKNLLATTIGLTISIGGTLYYPIFNWILNQGDTYFYADAIRYIGYRPDTNDQVCNEIPAYSNVTGDLHAHYIDIIFVFITLALLLNYILRHKKYNLNSNLLNPNIIILGLILGLQKMTNYWDLPIYFVIISAIIAAKNLVQNGFNKKNIGTIFLTILEIIIIEELVSLPFSLDLYISATTVCFANSTSPLYKMAVLWGFPVLCLIINIIILIRKYLNKKEKRKENLLKYMSYNFSELYVLILGICALGLIIIPELIYLKDIYSAPYERFNTVFKLTYQSYIIFCICTNYTIMRLLLDKQKSISIIGFILLLVQISTISYGIDAIQDRYLNSKHIGLSESEILLQNNLPNDYESIQWIKENIEKDKIILESISLSSSYTHHSRISVFTGNPTVLGWSSHEWIWRANKDYSCPQEVLNRKTDIYTIYTTDDIDKAKELIKKYNISYIYIGEIEYKDYSDINLNLLLDLGEIVYEGNSNINTYLIRVD